MCGIDSIAMFYKTLLRVENGLQWNIDVKDITGHIFKFLNLVI